MNENTPSQGLWRSISDASLEAHMWLGLALSAAMYLICLSGALAVFNQEFERWEQPAVVESEQLNPKLANTALEHFVARYGIESDHWYFVFPTSGIPRMVIENDEVAHFVNEDGSLGEVESFPWTSMLIDLHYYLHLPSTLGIVIVSACGVMLLALTLSGVFAHRRIFRDAFRFRRGGRGTQERIDLHNRLSVWGLPFHLMISFTGAYYGLAGVLLYASAQAFYNGDIDAVTAPVFTPEPVGLSQPGGVLPDISSAIEQTLKRDLQGTPLFLTVHDPNTEDAFVEVYMQQAGRLIYAESYRYDSKGNYVGSGGYRDGSAGKQIIYSLYRLHFGDFAGVFTKLIYFILGLTLAVISATGVSIWLAKRTEVSVFDHIWPAFVWGAPLSLAIAGIMAHRMPDQLTALFWWVLVTVIVVGSRWRIDTIAKRLRFCLAGALLLLLIDYAWQNGWAIMNEASWPVSAFLLLAALCVVPGSSVHTKLNLV